MHDLTIKAITYSEVKRTENDEVIVESKASKVHEFRVKRNVLCAASPVLRKLLTGGFREAEQTTVELHDDYVQALGLWLRIIHAPDAAGVDGAVDAKGFGYRDVELRGVWELLSMMHKYEIDPKEAKTKAWFVNW